MSAIGALKGYRTQFLFSLYYILSNFTQNYTFKLEGEEDLDVLDEQSDFMFAIQVKNLTKILSLSDILSENKTSFLRRYLLKYPSATPVLVSFGPISGELRNWASSAKSISPAEYKLIKKYQITEKQWLSLKENTQFIEVEETAVITEILKLLKNQFQLIDPEPTAANILYWLQYMAEKQIPITAKDLFLKVQDFTLYESQSLSVAQQYGLVLKPLSRLSLDTLNNETLEEEFYKGTNARYEHILLDLDVSRMHLLHQITDNFSTTNVMIVKGASGQGKSTLAYRYAYHTSPQNLVFELNIQEDPLASQKAIQAIMSISKHLSIPILFLIHVKPNSTEWIKIVREFSGHSFLRFLITVRFEDWFKATAVGIDFLHKELEVSLDKKEAEAVYRILTQKNKNVAVPNFDEAWIKLGNNSPMLEFVYYITQGDSLRNRLKQQVLQLQNEDNQTTNYSQTEFLRIASLANSFGTKIDISKLDYGFNIQFLIERLEKEFIIKVSEGGKYISGVHLLRSEILSDILFDDFASSKNQYALKCLPVIADADGYIFLLHCFLHCLLTPDEVIAFCGKLPGLGWASYSNIQRSLIWVGIRNYIHTNSSILDECYETYGDGWILLIDIFHGNTHSAKKIADSLPLGENFNTVSDSFNSRMSNKRLVYEYVEQFFNEIDPPDRIPSTETDWEGFSTTLFWLANTSNCAKPVIDISPDELRNAFDTLEVKKLAALMLGMYYYSEYYNNLRKELSHHFISRFQYKYNVAHVVIADDISADYIIDILNKEDQLSNNDSSMEIIDLLRQAFPDSIKFDAKGHGHRLQIIPLSHDDSQKGILVENLPLDNWVNINATTNRLYTFTKKPCDWPDYHDQIEHYKLGIQNLLKEFNGILGNFLSKKADYQELLKLVENANYPYTPTVKEPQSISDSLGIYFETQKKNADQQEAVIQIDLKTKYAELFKSQNGFHSGVENFIRQSGKALFARLNNVIDPAKDKDSDSERLSKINLYDAIENYKCYMKQRAVVFGNSFAGATNKILLETLSETAILWNAYLNSNRTGIYKSQLSLISLKEDFEKRIIKSCKALSKSAGTTVQYIKNDSTSAKPVFIIDTQSPHSSLIAFKEVYIIVKEAVGSPDYTSLKYLMLRLWFSKFYFIQLTRGRMINNHWNEMPLYLFTATPFENLAIHNFVSQPVDIEVNKNLGLKNWNTIIPQLDDIQKLSGSFFKMRLLVEHLYDLNFFETVDLNEAGKSILKTAVKKAGYEIQESLQYILNYLTDLITLFPFNADTYKKEEVERAFWDCLISVKENIFPTDKGDEEDYTLELNISLIKNWIPRLELCTESWGMFLLLLYGKYIRLGQNSFDKIC